MKSNEFVSCKLDGAFVWNWSEMLHFTVEKQNETNAPVLAIVRAGPEIFFIFSIMSKYKLLVIYFHSIPLRFKYSCG